MNNGIIINNWYEDCFDFFVNKIIFFIIFQRIDSLQASFPGVQVLNGDIDEAICFHALYFAIWKKFGILPERYNW